MVTEKVREILSRVLKIHRDKIQEEALLTDDLGVDSMELFEIIIRLEEQFDIELPQDAADHIATVGDLAQAVCERME